MKYTMKVIYVKNFRKGLATNSSSTHSIIYKKSEDLFKDLGVFENDYFGRCTETIAATREAKIKYIFHCIYRNEPLVKRMAARYPEMKQYFPLAKKAYEDENFEFGEYGRGCLYSPYGVKADKDFDFDYLCSIIETENAVIVGGSDEMDFVYDTIRGKEEIPLGGDVYDWDYPFKKNDITRNGNYYVAYGNCYQGTSEDESERIPPHNCSGGRLRFMIEDSDPIPEYPELIDLRITNRCDHGCKFCFMNSNMNEKDADIDELRYIIRNLKTRTEFSIGGGNILLYPHLESLFKTLDENGHIINVTINVADCAKIVNDKRFKKLFAKYVDGIGVSVFSVADVETFLKFQEAFSKIGGRNDKHGFNCKYIVMHTIPEYIGFEKMMEIKRFLNAKRAYAPILFLGYKENGRGANCEYHKFTEKEIAEIFKNSYAISIDTTFAKRYKEYIDKAYSTRYSLTPNEGEYSMYIDGVTLNAYKSSYELDKPYYIGFKGVTDWHNRMDALKAFTQIRKDGGFPVYESKHYWEDQ